MSSEEELKGEMDKLVVQGEDAEEEKGIEQEESPSGVTLDVITPSGAILKLGMVSRNELVSFIRDHLLEMLETSVVTNFVL